MPRQHKLTKNILLENIVNEINQDYVVLKSNSIFLQGNPYVEIVFIKSNYSDDNEISLNASILYEGSYIIDFFTLCKAIYGDKYRALTIRNSSLWLGSSMQKETREVYGPLVELINNKVKFQIAINNKKLTLGDKEIPLE